MSDEATWQGSMPECYDRCLGPALFAPHAQHLAALATTHAPGSVLELAAGTGIVTAELLRTLPTAQITGTDLNPAMVSWAAQHVSGPTWQPADAQCLPFPDTAFDMVVCQFGVMFFPDKVKAFAEAARVLRPGGLFLFSVWDTVDTSRFPAALVAALDDVTPDSPPDFVVRIPHGYHDADRIKADAAAGGLAVDAIDRVVLRGSTPSARALAEGFCYGTPLRFALQERGDVRELADAVAERMSVYLGSGRVEGDLAAYVVSARRA